ncbi:CshA/CshB family fibrillar adhesin-related protein [Bifidobacterium sp. ESL0728]|uniref:CshA/CshB family fibrillar adhesin-related protein n=1 Tax=Bifidobacterium sp. ESL0728 TaxID=2983220 RepID=UPI0023F9D6AC|nr:CshA/CshB family fibrillar adhesin-related protein [Bifidobacterium sp. ESL0728]WEV59030.1 CshA/CshB family fibrillar adhesin-related protein [Bifidobacterium sp. ESL0728]
MFRHRGLAKFAGVVGAAAMALTGAIAFTNSANAVSATDGNGRMSPSINWVEWGNAKDEITTSKTTWTTPVKAGDNTWLATRCDIQPVGGDSDSLSSDHAVTVYRPGSWYGDGLSQMYYTSGSGSGNTMNIGLANKDDAEKVTFDFSCAAYKIDSSTEPTLTPTTSVSGYTNINLQGLVFADAESNNWTSYQQEYIKATPKSSLPSTTASWRVLDSHRTDGCTTNSVAEMKGDTVRFRSDGGQCGNSGGTGPSSVMFLQNSESARVTLKGGGKTAVALGSIAATDFGDAPAGIDDPNVNYGIAGSLLQPNWKGGKLGTDVTGTTYSKDPLDPDTSMVGGTLFNLSKAKDDFSSTKPTLASFDQPTPRLGATEDSEVRSHPTGGDLTDFEDNADWDDKNGDSNTTVGTADVNDEDGVAIPTDTKAIKVKPSWAGSTGKFTQKVRCYGTGDVRGWIDWNRNGHFDDVEATANTDKDAEASDQVQCAADPIDTVTGYSATLTWIVPGDSKRQIGSETKSSYMRLRITDDAGTGPHGIVDMQAKGLTTSGEVEDYKADVHIPSLTILTSIGGNRKDINDQFNQSIKDSSDNPIVDIPDVPTTGTVSGLQPTTNGPVSVGPNQTFHISDDVTGGTSHVGDYTSTPTCLDISKTPAKPVTVTAGVMTMPPDFDANVQCTFTKNVAAAQSITINTIVNNNHGGQKTGDDFPTTVTDNSSYNQVYQSDDTSGSISKTLPAAGTYQIIPAAPGTGYHQVGDITYTDSDSGAALTPVAAGIAIAAHQHVVVTRVLEDEPAKLTLKTVVDNTYGGTATSNDFDFTVIPDGKSAADGVKYVEGVQQTTAAGKYSITGSDKPGYSQDGPIAYHDDTANVDLTETAAKIALANGHSVTGVRTVRSNPANLTVTTHIEGGGNATIDDFPVTATLTGGSVASMPNSTAKTVASGTYTIVTDMSAQPGYKVTDELACVVNGAAPVDVNDTKVALLNGQNVVCEQTVAPQSDPTLTFETQVLGNGKAKPGDFNFAVTPSGGSATTYTQGKAQVPGSTDFTVTGSNKAGYAQVGDIVYYANDDTARAHPMTLAQAQQALRNGRSVTGVRQVKPTSIKVHVDRDYRYGGTEAGDGSKITVNPASGTSFDLALDEQEDIAPGTFSVRQFLNAGYKLNDIKVTANGAPVKLNADGSFAVNLGDEVVVTLKNVDEPGTLKWSRFDKDGKTLLSGSKWRLNGPDGQTLDVEDCTAEVCTGLDQDPTPGEFSVTGLKWGDWTITETVAPAGHELSKPLPLTLNPAEGKYGLLKTGVFQDGKSADVTPGAKPVSEDGAKPAPGDNAKPAPGDGAKPAPGDGVKPKQNAKKSGPQLSDTGSDIAVVVMIAFATLALGFVIATGTAKALRRREE